MLKTLALTIALSLMNLGLCNLAQAEAKSKFTSEQVSAMKQLILKAPGTVSCYTNPQGVRLVSCEHREEGVRAFMTLYKSNRKDATETLKKRFAAAPDPNGVFFPILIASLVKDKSFVIDLKKVQKKMPESLMAEYAAEAIQIIEAGACKATLDPKFRELCP